MTKRTAHNLDWVPPGRVVSMRPAGEWWDAVRVPRAIGLSVLGRLGDDTGAVIEDPGGRLFYWLVPTGHAVAWEFHPAAQVQVLRETAHVAVPGPQRTAGPQWRVPPTRGRCLTDASQLRAALEAAVSAALGPREIAGERAS
ncbi:hypothetical protein [Streptomyces sp. NBC_01481]|uniref:hypothetical protein n=1 Tax=Streptomyces sp. NBC_01481 TaxID=2975869 RepID=UPI002250413A|nr:hypothetical protein [Streptomyces sp. NBC_01481]MCX4582450.1 hypothetical protein [Streptomyces sp. NBC_01481]